MTHWADSFLQFLQAQGDFEYIPDIIDYILSPHDRVRCLIPIRTVVGVNYHGLFKKWRTLSADYIAAEFTKNNIMPPPSIAAKQHGFITDIMFGSMHIIRILTLARQPLKKLYMTNNMGINRRDVPESRPAILEYIIFRLIEILMNNFQDGSDEHPLNPAEEYLLDLVNNHATMSNVQYHIYDPNYFNQSARFIESLTPPGSPLLLTGLHAFDRRYGMPKDGKWQVQFISKLGVAATYDYLRKVVLPANPTWRAPESFASTRCQYDVARPHMELRCCRILLWPR